MRFNSDFTSELTNALNRMGVHWNLNSLHIILPIGISFYTLQTLSCSWDIYRRELKPTRDILDFALFVFFFPTLLADPIERAKNLMPQIIQKRNASIEQFYRGCYLLLWGLFKKVCIADSLGVSIPSRESLNKMFIGRWINRIDNPMMFQKKLILYLLFFILLFPQTSFSLDKINHRNIESLIVEYDALVSNYIETSENPGVAVAIVADGKIVLLKGYGVKKAGKSDQVNRDTTFRLASVSKGFASVLTGLLVEDGVLQSYYRSH
jgi:hypothetical protein